ncbi:hypothetical protein TWF694_004435 [Orbilia ellipsospora]|uniref:Uncharacterized protein n=1 Tax=Orbilia ellipsospora TaxID=2528407 RepID=A0AAV9WV38_9PEZI
MTTSSQTEDIITDSPRHIDSKTQSTIHKGLSSPRAHVFDGATVCNCKDLAPIHTGSSWEAANWSHKDAAHLSRPPKVYKWAGIDGDGFCRSRGCSGGCNNGNDFERAINTHSREDYKPVAAGIDANGRYAPLLQALRTKPSTAVVDGTCFSHARVGRKSLKVGNMPCVAAYTSIAFGTDFGGALLRPHIETIVAMMCGVNKDYKGLSMAERHPDVSKTIRGAEAMVLQTWKHGPRRHLGECCGTFVVDVLQAWLEGHAPGTRSRLEMEFGPCQGGYAEAMVRCLSIRSGKLASGADPRSGAPAGLVLLMRSGMPVRSAREAKLAMVIQAVGQNPVDDGDLAGGHAGAKVCAAVVAAGLDDYISNMSRAELEDCVSSAIYSAASRGLTTVEQDGQEVRIGHAGVHITYHIDCAEQEPFLAGPLVDYLRTEILRRSEIAKESCRETFRLFTQGGVQDMEHQPDWGRLYDQVYERDLLESWV